MSTPCSNSGSAFPFASYFAPTMAESVTKTNLAQFDFLVRRCREADDQTIRELIAATFQCGDQEKQKALVSNELCQSKFPLLAPYIHRFPPSIDWDSMNTDYRFLFHMGEEIMRHPDDNDEQNLQALGQIVSSIKDCLAVCRSYKQVVNQLFQIGSEELKTWCLMTLGWSDLTPRPSLNVLTACVNRMTSSGFSFRIRAISKEIVKENWAVDYLLLLNDEALNVIFSTLLLSTENFRSLITSLQHPLNPQQKRLLIAATKHLFESDPVSCLQALTPAQMALLPFEEYPKDIQFCFISLSPRLTDTYAALAQFVGTLSPGEMTNVDLWMGPLIEIRPDSPVWIPSADIPLQSSMEALFKRFIESSALSTLEKVPKSFLLAHAHLIERAACWRGLLPHFTDGEIVATIPCWAKYFDRSMNSVAIRSGFPYSRALRVIDDPWLVIRLADEALSPRTKKLQDEKKDNTFHETLEVFEKEPWKLWVSFSIRYFLDMFEEHREEFKKAFPKCAASIAWFRKNQHLLDAITLDQGHPDGKKLCEILKDKPFMQQYFAAGMTGKAKSSLLFLKFFEWCDKEGFRQAILNGTIVEKNYDILAQLVGQMHAGYFSMPPPVAEEIRTFAEKTCQQIGVGEGRLPLLAQQYNNPAFADVKLRLGDETIYAHRALLTLRPFFTPFLQTQESPIAIPVSETNAVRTELQLLYGALPFEQLHQPDVQARLKQKPSLAEMSKTPFDDKIWVRETQVPVHRIALAGLGGGLLEFLSFTKEPFRIDGAQPEAVEAVLTSIYTGTTPEYAKEKPQEYRYALGILTGEECLT